MGLNSLKVWFRQINISLKCTDMPTEATELEKILSTVDSYNLCAGGPPVTYASNITSRTAFKDELVWRHNKCEKILERGFVCKECLKVNNTLTQAISRKFAKKHKNQF